MGFRFRKSVKLFPGIRMNLSKKGVGLSAGIKGLHFSSGPSGNRTTTSIPGTGISFVSQSHQNKTGGEKMNSKSAYPSSPNQKQKKPMSTRKKIIIIGSIGASLLLCLIAALIGNSNSEVDPTQTQELLATTQAVDTVTPIPTIVMTETQTAILTITPSPTPACICSKDYNCPDFVNPSDAQFCFIQCGGSKTNNWAGLDRDGDGFACEYHP